MDLPLFSLNSVSISITLFLDFFSILFLLTVSLITFRVFSFRNSYILFEPHYTRFHRILLVFVTSILFLILRPNLVRIFLGWDGLGLSSYLLVMYFNNSKSLNAAILTFITNRLGDALLLCVLV